MKKIVRLTESDLTRIVRRVIRETQEKEMEEGFLDNLFGGKDENLPKIKVNGKECDEVFICNSQNPRTVTHHNIGNQNPPLSTVLTHSRNGKKRGFVNSAYCEKYNIPTKGLKNGCPDSKGGWQWQGYSEMR